MTSTIWPAISQGIPKSDDYGNKDFESLSVLQTCLL